VWISVRWELRRDGRVEAGWSLCNCDQQTCEEDKRSPCVKESRCMHWKGGCLHLFASGSVLGFAFAVSLPFMQYSVFLYSRCLVVMVLNMDVFVLLWNNALCGFSSCSYGSFTRISRILRYMCDLKWKWKLSQVFLCKKLLLSICKKVFEYIEKCLEWSCGVEA
jgi:hypothetical protein